MIEHQANEMKCIVAASLIPSKKKGQAKDLDYVDSRILMMQKQVSDLHQALAMIATEPPFSRNTDTNMAKITIL